MQKPVEHRLLGELDFQSLRASFRGRAGMEIDPKAGLVDTSVCSPGTATIQSDLAEEWAEPRDTAMTARQVVEQIWAKLGANPKFI